MALRIQRIDWSRLARYTSIPAVVRVESVLVAEAIEGGFGGIQLTERQVEEPYNKDYDAVNPPSTWRASHPGGVWLLALALAADGDEDARDDNPGDDAGDEEPVGAVAAHSAGGTTATLWDIRVAPSARRAGVGRALIEHAAAWAASAGASVLVAETQNVNVPACRFYRSVGATLGAIDLHFYEPPLEDEAALFWRLGLPPPPLGLPTGR